MGTLTQSGAGVLLDREEVADPGCVARLSRRLDDERFVVLRNSLPTLGDALALLGRFGPINHAETRKDGAVLVETGPLDEVFRSNAALPLHKDGILTGFDVVIVGIYCVQFEEVVGGRTLVSDANRALQAVPAADVTLLRANGFEALGLDRTGYYRDDYTRSWTHFPAFRAKPGRAPSLHIGLPHADGEPESWRIRVPGVPADDSKQLLRTLRSALYEERYLYRHDWQPGDLLLMDNYAVLHGREAFQAKVRRLANVQVLAG